MFRRFEVRKKSTIDVLKNKGSMKGKLCVFSCYKKTNKVCLVYLQCKLQEDGIPSCISKLECGKTLKKRYLETSNQQTRYQ